MKINLLIFICAYIIAFPYCLGQHVVVKQPQSWSKLVFGSRFVDRFEPLPCMPKPTSANWGTDGVKLRVIENGIEDPNWSYWGGNIIKGEDGKYHMFVCRWKETAPRGHGTWPGSTIVRAVSKTRLGPYQVEEVIGRGHNPEAYQIEDGRYICYAIGRYYLGQSITGPWTRMRFKFHPRDRRTIASLTNLSFTKRSDGSFLMVNRGGGIWYSHSGVGPWEQVTQGSCYPKVKGRFEDPVIWHTSVQYHMIVNDWYGRIAYHLRSKDGFKWKVDPGEAYMPGIVVHSDGQREEWYKYERMKVLQDEHGRAIQANFAVIDVPKKDDKGDDKHSSKNIAIPLTVGKIVEFIKFNSNSSADKFHLRIKSEPGFNPLESINITSLRFGAPEKVDFGRGAQVLKSERSGNDLIVTFLAKKCGFTDHNFAGKLLGKTTKEKLLFAYTRLPWITYGDAYLSARSPRVNFKGTNQVLSLEIANYGLKISEETMLTVDILNDTNAIALTLQAKCPPLPPGAKQTLILDDDYTQLKRKKKARYRVWLEQKTRKLIYKTP